MSPRRFLPTASALALAVVGVGVIAAAPAHAAAYRYWTYWQGTPQGWAFATAGPAATAPVDGSVEGWRFNVTTQSGSAKDAPAFVADFTAICGQTPAEAGKKRVAVIVDPGSPAIAPAGQTPPSPISTCVVTDASATGYQVLRAAATVRTEDGLVCAIADYPTGECAPVVDDPVPTPSTASDSSSSSSSASVDVATAAQSAMPTPAAARGGSSTPWATIGVIVVAAGAALLVWWRRRA